MFAALETSRLIKERTEKGNSMRREKKADNRQGVDRYHQQRDNIGRQKKRVAFQEPETKVKQCSGVKIKIRDDQVDVQHLGIIHIGMEVAVS